jgi:hypothetical protein
MERRLQLLLDQERYDRVAAEAERSGRSVNAVIREAIDLRFPAEAEARSKAMLEWLEMTATPEPGPAEDFATVKRELEDAWDEDISHALDET